MALNFTAAIGVLHSGLGALTFPHPKYRDASL